MINKILSNIISKYFNIKINNISGNNISNSIIELLQHADQINKTLGIELIKAQINKIRK